METITPGHLADDSNHCTCECGNETIHDYAWSDDNGCYSCPKCMVNWVQDQRDAYKDILIETIGKALTLEGMNQAIIEKMATVMGIESTDVDNEFYEPFLLKTK